jgi:glucose-6-phosphate isomerase
VTAPDPDERLRALAQTSRNLGTLFATEPGRAEDMLRSACGILLDATRSHVSADLLAAIAQHATSVGMADLFAAMVAGDPVNVTEDRAALHVAGRTRPAFSFESRKAASETARMLALADHVVSSGRYDTVVNIGIGGSDLGPATAVRALRRFRTGPSVRFVANVDAADADEALADLDPARTLVVVVSKTFTTVETLHNGARAREWLSSSGIDWRENLVAVTAEPDAAARWGVSPDRCLVFDEGVGGRFSVSSPVGFSLACAVGPTRFSEFLGGMAAMDEHVAADPMSSTAFLHAAVWYAHHVVHRHPAVAVVPYSHDLARLPAHLQQLVMESNGKSVRSDGGPVTGPTCPVVWGEPGTNGQHAFFQFLHQGTLVTPVEFIGVLAATGDDEEAHDILLANLVAQAEVLARGRDLDSVLASGVDPREAPHRVLPGNRPGTVLLMDALDPRTFGALLALYEHSTVMQGWLCGVNSFDQFGVETGKVIAAEVAADLRGAPGSPTTGDRTMTHPLVEAVRARPRG